MSGITEEKDSENGVASELIIPSRWESVPFDDFFENIPLTGIKIPEKSYLSSGKFPVIDQGSSLVGGYANDCDKVIDRERALIVFGDHTKCFKYINFAFSPGADGIKVLEPRKPLDERFAYYGCKSIRLPNRGYSRHFSFLKNCRFPLAPLPEQHRIVAKIEELFSELDKGIESLKTAKEQLKVYRQAVLKHAFEGKLTAKWREENEDKLESADKLLARIEQEREARYQQQLKEWEIAVKSWDRKGSQGKRPAKPRRQKELSPLTEDDVADLSPLPAGWIWVKLGQLVWSVKDGPHYSPKYSESGIPFITGGNVRPGGIDFSSAKFITADLHEELSARCKPEKGDVLYTKGGTTGIARVNTCDVDFNVWVHVAVLKITESLRPFYLQHALNSPICFGQSQKYTHGVGNQDLGLTRMVNIVLPLCSEAEQYKIIEIFERLTSEFDAIEVTVDNELGKAEALRQSILKKAFSGQLVPHDPNDEPASGLLERIKAEKAEQANGRKNDKRKDAA